MSHEKLLCTIRDARQFFDRGTACLDESDSAVCPAEGCMNAAQQVAHVAHTVDWFREGIFSPTGFDMDFEKHAREVMAVTSLGKAREWLGRAFDELFQKLAETPWDELQQPIAPGMIMGGEPRHAVGGAITDHTAHHRGALSVYARLAGKTPAMPYL
ncbi:MAG: DinB family protein [Planctomycetes bacterium]|nr:DinB family protein [Planctomycetota bacterium]